MTSNPFKPIVIGDPLTTHSTTGNYVYDRRTGESIDRESEDVSSHLSEWARGNRLLSRLAWADTLRNTRILYELSKKEPMVIVDLGCGDAHPIGAMVAGSGLDSYYVGIDADYMRACNVANEHGRRPFAAVCADLSEAIPIFSETADAVVCLEAMEHFCKTEDDVLSFFNQVRRIMPRNGVFYLATPNPGPNGVLQHPHCHAQEFSVPAVKLCADKAGLRVWALWNYRARPQVAKKIRMQNGELAKGHGMPAAIVDAYMLPILTHGMPVPGNVLYTIGHA